MVVGGPVADAVSVLVKPRLLTEDDVPWLFYLCRKKYSQRYDAAATELWFRNIVLKSPILYLPQRTDNAFCISMLTVQTWLPAEFECHIMFMCADDGAMWEAMKLIRASIEWAKSRRCTVWKVASDTDIELAAMARRVGATEVYPRYTLRF